MSNKEEYLKIDLLKYIPLDTRVELRSSFRLSLFNRALTILGNRVRLSKLLDIHYVTTYDWELGKTRPTFNSILELSKLVGISRQEMIDNILWITSKWRGGRIFLKNFLINFDSKISEWFGLLKGDGCLSYKYVYLGNTCFDLVYLFAKILEERFGVPRDQITMYILFHSVTDEVKKLNNKLKYIGYSNVQFEKLKDKNRQLYLEARFDSKVLARTFDNLIKDIHDIINSSPESVKYAYIRGFYEAEGYPTERMIGVSNKDKKELEFIRNLFCELGFDKLSKLTLNYDKTKRKNHFGRENIYVFYILSKKNLELFRSKIGFGLHENRNKRLDVTIDNIKKEFKQISERAEDIVQYSIEFGKFDTKTLAKEFKISLRRSRDVIRTMKERGIVTPINKKPPFLYKISDSYVKNKTT